jgi:peptide/nickel transport system ATP-binding protein
VTATTSADDATAPDGTTTMHALEVTDLQVRFRSGPFYDRRDVVAVDGVSLHVARGETLGLVGESGSGKSSLARAVAGLCPSRGRIVIDGVEVPAGRRRHRDWAPRVQMVFQDPFASLNPRMAIGAAVEELLLVNRADLGPAERRDTVWRLLDAVGLGDRAGARPHELSGGQRQRAAIARALVLSPGLVLCDEPTSGLDLTTRAQVLALLRDLQERLGCAYLFVSHDLRIVHHISDRIAVMHWGRIVETGPSERVLRAPEHPYTRALVSAIPGRRQGAP